MEFDVEEELGIIIWLEEFILGSIIFGGVVVNFLFELDGCVCCDFVFFIFVCIWVRVVEIFGFFLFYWSICWKEIMVLVSWFCVVRDSVLFLYLLWCCWNLWYSLGNFLNNLFFRFILFFKMVRFLFGLWGFLVMWLLRIVYW